MNAIPKSAVRDIVVRARAGDQVAMGIIAEVRDRAKKGNKTAQESVALMNQYIKKNPPSRIGHDLSDITQTAQVDPRAVDALWKGIGWSPNQFGSLVAKVAPHVSMWHIVVAIVHGPALTANDNLAKAAQIKDSHIGKCVRIGNMLRKLKNPAVPISAYCKQTGWELGE